MKRQTNNDALRKIYVDDVLSKPSNFIDSTGKVFLVRCPKCARENWAASVASGKCCWCQWSAYR